MSDQGSTRRTGRRASLPAGAAGNAPAPAAGPAAPERAADVEPVAGSVVEPVAAEARSAVEPAPAEPAPAEPAPAEPARRPQRAPRTRTRRPRDRRAADRVLLAAATVAVLGGTVAASSLLALPRVDAAAVHTTVTPAADGLQLGCAGPLLVLAESAPGEPAAVSALNAPVRASGSAAAISERPLEAELQGTAARAFAVESAPDPAGKPVPGAAAQSQFGSSGLVGLAASACATPAADAWLVGGSTAVGRTTLVNLSNPTKVAAVVDLTLVGEAGPITPAGASGIAVPAGGQVVVPLSGLAPDVAAPMVRVQSRGGRVVATLQQSTVRGIDPGGVDTFGATAAPARQQFIPGVRVKNSPALGERVTAEDSADLETVVRMFVPGDEQTEVRIGVTPDRAGALGTSVAFQLEPAQVVDVPIAPLADGSYTVTLDADLPIVAAVRQSSVTAAGGTDFAWLAAVDPIPAGTQTWVSVTPGPNPGLYLHNPTGDRVTGTLSAPNGAAIPVSVEPGATQVVPVLARQSYRLDADGELRGAVAYLGGAGIAGYPVLPAPAAATPVTVYPG